MTKGTKAFRIIISILLALTMLCTAFFSLAFYAVATRMVLSDEYGIFVAGVPVTRANKGDILGDGTVSYHASSNTLTFDHAVIETDTTIVYSTIDLAIELIGENKFVCTSDGYAPVVYIADYYLNKDLSIQGEGSLILEYSSACTDTVGIMAADLTVGADITVITPNCTNIVNGIVCDSSLLVLNKATITVQSGVGTYSMGVRVRGNVLLEEGSALNVSVSHGAVETCKALSVNGDLVLGKGSSVNVSVEDESAAAIECIRVTGVIDVGADATLTATAKNTYGIECQGAMKLGKGATVSATADEDHADIFCYGSLVHYGATLNGEVDALGGIHERS